MKILQPKLQKKTPFHFIFTLHITLHLKQDHTLQMVNISKTHPTYPSLKSGVKETPNKFLSSAELCGLFPVCMCFPCFKGGVFIQTLSKNSCKQCISVSSSQQQEFQTRPMKSKALYLLIPKKVTLWMIKMPSVRFYYTKFIMNTCL